MGGCTSRNIVVQEPMHVILVERVEHHRFCDNVVYERPPMECSTQPSIVLAVACLCSSSYSFTGVYPLSTPVLCIKRMYIVALITGVLKSE